MERREPVSEWKMLYNAQSLWNTFEMAPWCLSCDMYHVVHESCSTQTKFYHRAAEIAPVRSSCRDDEGLYSFCLEEMGMVFCYTSRWVGRLTTMTRNQLPFQTPVTLVTNKYPPFFLNKPPTTLGQSFTNSVNVASETRFIENEYPVASTFLSPAVEEFCIAR